MQKKAPIHPSAPKRCGLNHSALSGRDVCATRAAGCIGGWGKGVLTDIRTLASNAKHCRPSNAGGLATGDVKRDDGHGLAANLVADKGVGRLVGAGAYQLGPILVPIGRPQLWESDLTARKVVNGAAMLCRYGLCTVEHFGNKRRWQLQML